MVRFVERDRRIRTSRIVSESEGMPNDNVFILNGFGIADPGFDTCPTQRLVGVVSSRKELSVLVLGHPEGMLCKL